MRHESFMYWRETTRIDEFATMHAKSFPKNKFTRRDHTRRTQRTGRTYARQTAFEIGIVNRVEGLGL